MNTLNESFTRVHAFLHHNLLLCLLSVYALAVVIPQPGVIIRTWHFPTSSGASVLSIMLGILLFNAGLGIRSSEIRRVRSSIKPLLAGLLTNFALPAAFVALFAILLSRWHDFNELGTLVISLALIGSMPIAGASATWAQEADGNLTLSLGLIFFSTLLSPLVSPLAFQLASLSANGTYHEVLMKLSNGHTSNFLFWSVVFPTVLGIACHFAIGDRRREKIIPLVKIVSVLSLMILNYSNASVALPQAFANPDYDFLVLAVVCTLTLCLMSFGAGFGVSKIMGLQRGESASLMFGLGMNNNGTGLVFASLYLSGMPSVLLPIVLYNLEQQIIAGCVQYFTERYSGRIWTAQAEAS